MTVVLVSLSYLKGIMALKGPIVKGYSYGAINDSRRYGPEQWNCVRRDKIRKCEAL